MPYLFADVFAVGGERDVVGDVLPCEVEGGEDCGGCASGVAVKDEGLCGAGVEWLLPGDGCGDDGEEDGGFSGFGWCVEADGPVFGDEGPCDPFFVVVGLGPECVPVDDVGCVVDVGGGVGCVGLKL